MTSTSHQLPFGDAARPHENTPAALQSKAYVKFGTEVDKLEAVFAVWTVGTVAGDRAYLHPLLKASDSLPIDVVLRDVGSVVALVNTGPDSSIHRALDDYITSRVSPASFADNFAALAYYDLLDGDGQNGARVELYQKQAMAAFVSSGGAEEMQQALAHVYDMNEDMEGAGVTIGSLPKRSIKVLFDALTETAIAHIQESRIADPELIRMSTIIHRAAKNAGLIEPVATPKIDLFGDGPQPV